MLKTYIYSNFRSCEAVAIYKTAWRHNPEDHNRHRYYREKLTFQLVYPCGEATLRRVRRLVLFQPWRWRRYEDIQNVVNHLPRRPLSALPFIVFILSVFRWSAVHHTLSQATLPYNYFALLPRSKRSDMILKVRRGWTRDFTQSGSCEENNTKAWPLQASDRLTQLVRANAGSQTELRTSKSMQHFLGWNMWTDGDRTGKRVAPDTRTTVVRALLISGHGSHFKNKAMTNFGVICPIILPSFINVTKWKWSRQSY
jgi:hypothetical protein